MKRKMTFGRIMKYLLVVLQILNCSSSLIHKMPAISLKIEIKANFGKKEISGQRAGMRAINRISTLRKINPAMTVKSPRLIVN